MASQDAALDQAINYVELFRTEKGQNTLDDLHIIVAIGTYLRAFTHKQGTDDVVPFSVWLKTDEARLHGDESHYSALDRKTLAYIQTGD